MATLLPTEVQELLNLPQEDADRQEEEKAGEEDREEDKKVNVGLVLSQKQQALGLSLSLFSSNTSQSDVKATRFQGVHLMGEGDHHAISNTTDNQHRLGFPHGDIGDESFSTFLSNFPFRSWRFCLQALGKHRTCKVG